MILSKFQLYLQERFTNQQTIKGYLRDASDFHLYTDTVCDSWELLKERHIKNYMLALKKEGFSEHSIARKSSAIRLFLKFLRKEGIMIHNPMEDIVQPPIYERQVTMNEKEQRELCELMKKDERDYALFLLLTLEKIKVSEIIELHWNHLQEENSILYSPKADSKRVIKEETLRALRAYRLTQENGELTMFLSRKKKKITVNGLHHILNGYFKQINRQDLRPIDLTKVPFNLGNE